MVAACRRDLGERGIAPPYRLLAMSLGAMVAADWLGRHPAEIGACVLINTSLRPYARFYQRLRPIAYAPLLRLLLTHPDERTVERTILHLTSARTDEDRMLDSWVAWRRSHPVSSGNTLRQLLAAARYRARREAPRMPVLLLAGGRDRLVDPRCSQRLAAAWHCRLAVHPDAGHDLPLDDDAWVLHQIDGWCRDLGIAGAAHHDRRHDRQND
jgi:pimeloyl-ACP methyl ester carboxylesterase